MVKKFEVEPTFLDSGESSGAEDSIEIIIPGWVTNWVVFGVRKSDADNADNK